MIRERWNRLSGSKQVWLVLLLGVGAFAALMLFRPRPPRQTPPRQVPAVTTVPIRLDSGALRVRGGGTVRASAEVRLAAEVGGRVAWVSPALVSGGRVSAGQVVARIDPADYENAVQRAGADVAARQVELLQAEEEVALARDEYRRLQAREGVDGAPVDSSSLLFRQPQLAAARAALRRAEAGLSDARLSLERTRLRAPFDAIVRSESVDRGQFIPAGQSVASLYATDAVEIVVPLSDRDAALIGDLWDARAGGDGARIQARILADYGGRTYTWEGRVDRAEGDLDERTRTVDVVVRVEAPFDGDDGRPPLLLGTYARVDIEGTDVPEYAVLPAGVLRDGPAVWLVENDSILVIRPVEVLQAIDDSVYLRGELPAGRPVIVTAMPLVTHGMTVQITRPLESRPAAEGDR